MIKEFQNRTHREKNGGSPQVRFSMKKKKIEPLSAISARIPIKDDFERKLHSQTPNSHDIENYLMLAGKPAVLGN